MPTAQTSELSVESLLRETAAELTDLLARTSTSFAEIPAALDANLRTDQADGDDAEIDRRAGRQSEVAEKIAKFAAPYLHAALTAALAHYRQLPQASGIRSFFREPKPEYSLPELAAIWGSPLSMVKELFRATDYDINSPSTRISFEDALNFGLWTCIFTGHAIEDALGDNDFSSIRAHVWQTRAISLRLPAWVIDAVTHDDGQSQMPEMENRLEALLYDEYRNCAPDVVRGIYLAAAQRGEKL